MIEERKQRRQLWVILIVVFFGFVGISIPYLIFPVLFLNPLYSILPSNSTYVSSSILLGITLAAYPLGQFIGSPVLGALSDDYGRKKLLASSLFITSISNFLTAISIEWQHIELLIFTRFLAGLMEGNVAIARAMAADLKTIPKHEAFGKINAFASIAFLLGPLIGGVMTDKNVWSELTPSTPFYTISFLFLFLSGISAFALESKREGPIEVKNSFWERLNIINRLKILFTNKYLQFLMITSTAFTLAVDIFYEFAPAYLTLKWNLSPVGLVLYNALLCIGLVIGSGWLASFLSQRISRKKTIIYAIGLFALLLIGIILINSTYLMLVLFGLIGVFIGLTVTLITVKISDSVSDGIQGEVMGIQLSLRVLGDGLICLLGGVLLLFSPKLILILAVVLSISSMAYYIRRKVD